eukprot:COSAG04_NODE_3767_length_2549_cov_1.971837_1_plen_151_part_00
MGTSSGGKGGSKGGSKGGTKRGAAAGASPKAAKRQRSADQAGGANVVSSTTWSAQQYAKYEVFKQEQKEAREAELWSPSTAGRAPPKLEFKNRLDETGPASSSTIIESLVAMGFTTEQAETAAKATKGASVESAAAFLLTGAAARGSRRR